MKEKTRGPFKTFKLEEFTFKFCKIWNNSWTKYCTLTIINDRIIVKQFSVKRLHRKKRVYLIKYTKMMFKD